MTLEAGARLGPYEILSPLGAGGMGEVYKARDTRLGRDVAVKVLPQQLSASPELRQRLEREAKTISQLSHPHICTLYDVGEADVEAKGEGGKSNDEAPVVVIPGDLRPSPFALRHSPGHRLAGCDSPQSAAPWRRRPCSSSPSPG